MRKLFSSLLIFVLLTYSLSVVTFCEESSEFIPLTAKISGCAISTQMINNSEHLFLPSGADCSAIEFESLSGVVSISVNNSSASKNSNDTWNLGEIESGVQYTLQISFIDTAVPLRTITMIKSSGISSLFVTGDKDIEYLNASKNNTCESGVVMKLAADGSILANSALNKIKGRGHTTWTGSKDKNSSTDKKPYNLTTKDKVQLIADANSAERKYSLLCGSYNDFSGAMNYTALSLYKQIGGDAYVDVEPVDFYYNGEYRGLYIITDKVEIDKDLVDIKESVYVNEDKKSTTRYICKNYDSYFDETLTNNAMWSKAKVNAIEAPSDDKAINAGILAYSYATDSSATSTGGVLFEISHQYYDEACWFITNHGVMISLKSPEYATKKQVQDIAIYVQDFENALMSQTGFNSKGKHYTEYVDIKSLAKSFLLNCFTSQNDFFDCSEFFFIDGDGSVFSGKMKSGPAWDYDVSHYGYSIYSTKSAEGLNGRRIWLRQFLTKGDFVSELYNLQKGDFATALDTLSNKILTDYATDIKDSVVLDQAMWLYDVPTADKLSVHQSNIASRLTSWKNIWSDKTNSLRGIYIREENDSIVALSSGATKYQWYKIADNYTTSSAIDGATSSTYTPTSSGIYYASAYGNTLTGSNVYTMFSNPVVYSHHVNKDQETFSPFADVSDSDYYFDAVIWATKKNITTGASNTIFAPNTECNRGQMATFLWRAAGSPEPKSNTCNFVDININDYYYKAILWAVENGITNGTSETTFSPKQTVTRAQAVTFISRLSGGKANHYTNTFSDVDPNSYYFNAVLWALENNITQGTSANTFSPDNICTRGQIITFLYRFFTN